MVDEKRLQEIAARVAAASPEPWRASLEGRDHESGSDIILVGTGSDRRDDIELVGAASADCDFIANARQDVPVLLEEVARLRALTSNETSVLLLDATSNQAVVKLPGRVFPGVVLHGDTLHVLRGDVSEALDLLRAGDGASAESALGAVLERLADVLAHYEAVAGRSGYKLPY